MSSDHPENPTEKNDEARGPIESDARILLRLAKAAGLIDPAEYSGALAALNQDPAFDVRSHLENQAGLEPSVLLMLDRYVRDMVDSGEAATEQLERTIAEATRVADAFELNGVSGDSPEAPSEKPDTGLAHTETEADENGRRLSEERTYVGGSLSGVELKSDDSGEGSRYRLINLISKGGQAAVYRAWDVELKRIVAIKTVNFDEFRHEPPDKQVHICGRFVQEAFVTGRLNHPAIIPIYALGFWRLKNPAYAHLPNGIPHLALPYYPKGELAEEIRKLHAGVDSSWLEQGERNLALRAMISSLVSVCRAVSHAHERGFIHRDIKPRNVLIGHYGEVYLADWGLARSILPDAEAARYGGSGKSNVRSGSDETEGDIYGTSEYMSPEQANGHVRDHNERTDIFLLGATLYSLLFGHAPYASKSKPEAYRKATSCEIDFSGRTPGVFDSGLIAICRKAMSREQPNRYPSAMALVSDLERWLADLPLIEVEETRRRKAARFLRRQSRAITAAAMVSLLGSAGLAVANYQITNARNEAVRERNEKTVALENEQKALREARVANENLEVSNENLTVEKEKVTKNLAVTTEIALEFENLIGRILPEIEGTAKIRYESALGLAKNVGRLAGIFPSDANLYVKWGKAEREAGNVARFLGKSKDAASHYKKAMSIFNGVLRSNPENVGALIEKVLVSYDHALLSDGIGDYSAGERYLNQGREIIARLRMLHGANPGFDELEYVVLIENSSLLGELGRVEDQAKVLDRIATLERTWLNGLKALSTQQFKLSIMAKFERANFHFAERQFDRSAGIYDAVLTRLGDEIRKIEAAGKANGAGEPFDPELMKLEPDYRLIQAEAHLGLAEVLSEQGEPQALKDAFPHFRIAYEAFASLDGKANGAQAYRDNLLQAYAGMRKLERIGTLKFGNLMSDQDALRLAESLITNSEAPGLKVLRGMILAEMAQRATDAGERTGLAERARADFDAAIEKLPLRQDIARERNDLDAIFRN